MTLWLYGKNKLIAASIVFALGSLAFGLFLIRPLLHSVRQSGDRLTELANKHRELSAKEQAIALLERDLDKVGEQGRKALVSYFPVPESLTPQIEYLEQLASAHGNTITLNIADADNPSLKKEQADAKVAGAEELMPVIFTINLRGDYSSLMQFMRAAEHAPFTLRIMKVESAGEINQEGKPSGNMSTTMTAVLYTHEEKK